MNIHTIGVDLDNVLNNLTSSWVQYLNGAYNYNLTIEDMTYYDMVKNYPELTEGRVCAILKDRDFWKHQTPKHHSRKYMKRLHEEGYDLKVITSSNVGTIDVKLRWVLDKFPFLTEKDMIVTHNKQMISGIDVLIDDYEKNLISGNYIKILFDYPYNRNISDQHGLIRATSWKHAYDLVSALNEGGSHCHL